MSVLTRYGHTVLMLGALFAAVSGTAQALSSDREQPIVIEAAAAEADHRAQVTIYRGDVVITQGTLRITGDTVWIHYDDANTITKAISVGKPAKFRQLTDGSEDYMTADAERMEYHADQDLILLLGNARYGEGKDKITAPRIVYDSRRGRVKAGANADGSQAGQSPTGQPDKPDRVRITITPKKK
jgi:lipopolysaccharide export system protein LptA